MGKAAFKIKANSTRWDVDWLVVLVAALGQNAIHVGAAGSAARQHCLGGDASQCCAVIWCRHAAGVKHAVLLVELHDFGQDPVVHINPIRYRCKADWPATTAGKLGGFTMQARDAVFGFGKFNRQRAEVELPITALLLQP